VAALRFELVEYARTLFYALALRIAPGWAVPRIAGGALTRKAPPR
jgi:hypothetical protein